MQMMLGKRKLGDRPSPFHGSTASGHLKPVWKPPLTPTTEKNLRVYRVVQISYIKQELKCFLWK